MDSPKSLFCNVSYRAVPNCLEPYLLFTVKLLDYPRMAGPLGASLRDQLVEVGEISTLLKKPRSRCIQVHTVLLAGLNCILPILNREGLMP